MKKQPLASLGRQLGSWAEYLKRYTTLIEQWGYSPASIKNQIQLIRRFIQWFRRRHAGIHLLDETMVQRFLRRRPKTARRGDAATSYRFLQTLREQAIVPPQHKPPLSSKQRLISNYERYLLEERGVAPAMVVNNVGFIHQFLSARFREDQLNPSQLRAPDVTDFVRHHAHKLSPGRAQLLVTSLRSFLRYLQHQGKIRADLAVCVPTVASWSFAAPPKFLPADSVQKVLDRSERRTPIGRRGIITIHGTKFGKSRLIPLHPSTQKVLSAYAERRDCFLGKKPKRILRSLRASLTIFLSQFDMVQLA
jgi:integrase